jgi:murein DD-endopeptidase MepM/ murein hydrolase activator NlpD
MRRHPILGYSKMHRGIDFAAPTGTPIMAAGNGTVRFAGRRGGYGKYVSIRHNAEYDTAYAHMSRIAPDVTPGKRVKQGDIIGYVGTTGRSTGPHLHYEVMVNNQQINPMSIKLPSGTKLAGKDLARFRAVRRAIEERLDRMPSSTLIAQAPAD